MWLRFAIIALGLIELGSCGVVGKGDLLAPAFCTVPMNMPKWPVEAYSLVLVISIPLALTALFVRRLPVISIILSLMAVAGLAVQPHLLSIGALGCDFP